jgi:hypothetical protein
MIRYIIFLLLAFIGGNSFAQFKFEGKLVAVDSSGFFQINLSHFVYNHLNKSRSDLRILDKSGKEVPYVWKEETCNGKDSSLYHPIQEIKFGQLEEQETKRSIVTITLPASERVDSIEIHANGPKYFKRFGYLSYLDYDSYQRKRKRKKEELSIRLSSDDTLKLSIYESKVKEFRLEIENGDNPPLKITQVIIKQKQHSLITYLEKGQTYSLLFGNLRAPSPNYDLEYFRSKLPKHLKVVAIDNISKKQAIPNVTAFYKHPGFIWTSIIMVIGILGFASFKMVKDLNKKAADKAS